MCRSIFSEGSFKGPSEDVQGGHPHCHRRHFLPALKRPSSLWARRPAAVCTVHGSVPMAPLGITLHFGFLTLSPNPSTPKP